jgi:hypothetical protein
VSGIDFLGVGMVFHFPGFFFFFWQLEKKLGHNGKKISHFH